MRMLFSVLLALLAVAAAEKLTFSVDMQGVDVSEDGVWVSGGKFGVSATNVMTVASFLDSYVVDFFITYLPSCVLWQAPGEDEKFRMRKESGTTYTVTLDDAKVGSNPP